MLRRQQNTVGRRGGVTDVVAGLVKGCPAERGSAQIRAPWSLFCCILMLFWRQVARRAPFFGSADCRMCTDVWCDGVNPSGDCMSVQSSFTSHCMPAGGCG